MIIRTFVPTLILFVIFLERQICEYHSEATGKNVSLVSSDRRHGRFLNLFSVIRFSNVPCTTKIGINGTCYTEKQCSGGLRYSSLSLIQMLTIMIEKLGVAQGTCAGGFGVCCTFSTKCGGTTYENSTYLSTDMSTSLCRYLHVNMSILFHIIETF